MSNMFQKFPETRALSGIGAGLLYKNESGKYSILAPVTKVKGVRGDSDKIDINVTTNDTTTQIEGMKKIESQEFEIYHHRDNMRRFTNLEGKVIDFIVFYPDYTGEKFSGTIYYKIGEGNNSDAVTATLTITPTNYDGYVDNVKPLMQKTALFKSVPNMITLDATTSKKEIEIEMDPSDATFTAISEATSIATASVQDNKLTITGVAKGQTLIELTSNQAECAPWKVTIQVDVLEVKTGA